jgi:hypothetical protein
LPPVYAPETSYPYQSTYGMLAPVSRGGSGPEFAPEIFYWTGPAGRTSTTITQVPVQYREPRFSGNLSSNLPFSQPSQSIQTHGASSPMSQSYAQSGYPAHLNMPNASPQYPYAQGGRLSSNMGPPSSPYGNGIPYNTYPEYPRQGP